MSTPRNNIFFHHLRSRYTQHDQCEVSAPLCPSNTSLKSVRCAWLPGTQEILLYEAMTVKETLTTAASFFTSDSSDVEQRVNEVLSMLGLQEQANTKVGGLFYRGCSGGQKRRITVGLFPSVYPEKSRDDVQSCVNNALRNTQPDIVS